MEQIIDGLRYDTSTATLLADDRYWDGSNWERHGTNTYLYKTKNGRYFLHYTTLWQGSFDSIEPISEGTAMEQWEALREKREDYEDAFGIKPEEA